MADAPAPTSPPDIHPIIQEMHTQNDRGAAIAGAAFLEEKLVEAIKQRWPTISNTMHGRLFAGYGPLSSFSAKIEIANAMGVLNVQSRADCNKIRVIRNKAAHLGTPFSFDDPMIQKHLDAIDCIKHFPLDTADDRPTRNQFTSAIKFLSSYLWFQEQWKKRHGFKAVLPDFGNKSSKNE